MTTKHNTSITKKYQLQLLFILVFFSMTEIASSQIIPVPVQIENYPGNFFLNSSTVLITDQTAESNQVAAWFKVFLKKPTGYEVVLKNKKNIDNSISISIAKEKIIALGTEGYKLTVTKNNVTLIANSGAGLFYGVQSLIQLLPKEIESNSTQHNIVWKIPETEIVDYPRFKWRGLMLDVSRHFFTVAELKQFIDEMVRFKFNLLHLHLSDDQGWRIEIKSFPELTKVGAWRVKREGSWRDRSAPEEGEPATYGGFYTQEQMKEVIHYALDRKVDILPEIDVPGHSLAVIASYNYLSCTKLLYQVNAINKITTEDNALCAGQEATFEFLDKVYGEIAALFPFKYIHIGGDECNRTFWAKCANCRKRMLDNGLKTTAELQSYFTKRIEKILHSKGKELLGWDEILEGGIAPTATVMSWRGMAGGIEAAKLKHKVVMSPTDFSYINYDQDNPVYSGPSDGDLNLKITYSFELVPPGIDSSLILGGQGNLWTEIVPHFRQVQYMLWPRSFALSEVFWSPKAKRNWTNFVHRTEVYSKRLDIANIKYSRAFYDATILPARDKNNKLCLKLETDFDDLMIYYSFDNTFPDNYSAVYESGDTLSIPRDADYFKMISYRNGMPIGKMITVNLDDLEKSFPKKEAK